jgi:hypothetical protein
MELFEGSCVRGGFVLGVVLGAVVLGVALAAFCLLPSIRSSAEGRAFSFFVFRRLGAGGFSQGGGVGGGRAEATPWGHPALFWI